MSHQGFASRNRTKRRYRFRHKIAGLCVNCSNKAVLGETRCKYHKMKAREYRERLKLGKYE